MHTVEENILAQIRKDTFIHFDEDEVLHSLPLGILSKEFYSDPLVKHYCETSEDTSVDKLRFRLALEEYINSDRSSPYLENIESAIPKLPSPMGGFSEGCLQDKAAGTYLMPLSHDLIRQVYLLKDATLIKLFQKHFPTPPPRLFNNAQIPDVIQQLESKATETVKKVALKTLEPFIIKAQRHIRMKIRHREEVQRIAQRDNWFLKRSHMSDKEVKALTEKHETPPQIHQWAEELLHDANTPYKPKCAPELSDRIMAAVKKVSAFSTVKHITSIQALPSILDDALYGRRTLMDFYLDFNPASLHECDILNGDANVVCLGPQGIDPKASGGIIIEFDLSKLIKNKPSAFYKQRDLEFGLDKIRQVRLGEKTIFFDHTGFVRCANLTQTYLKIINSDGGLKQVFSAQKSSFIAYNLEQIHEILTLNFFRFMDKMRHDGQANGLSYINEFYEDVKKLNDDEMLNFLTDIERSMTDTAEFNFYGAHRIDFSTLISISARFINYTLHLTTFITALKLGKIDELRQARAMIPELFQSYRFIDYLLSKIKHTEVRYYLDDIRKQCKTPEWIHYTPLLVPEHFDLHWGMCSEPNCSDQSMKF